MDALFVWFRFLVCRNYFHPLFVVIIMKVWLIVCLELRFWYLFLFFVFFSFFWGINFTLYAIVSSRDDFFVFLNISIRFIVSSIESLSFEYFFIKSNSIYLITSIFSLQFINSIDIEMISAIIEFIAIVFILSSIVTKFLME